MSEVGSHGYLHQAGAKYPEYLGLEWGPSLPVTIAMTLHALRVSYEVRKMLNASGRLPWFHEVFVLLTLSFGGGILTALLLGQPQPWLVNNGMVPTYSLVYLAVGFAPADIVYRILRAAAPLSDMALAAVDGAIRGYGVTASGVEMIRRMDGPISQSLTAMVVVGTLLGCGGGVIEDLIQMSKRQWAFRTPTLLQRPNYDMAITFTTVVFYILSTRAWVFSAQHPGLLGSHALDAAVSAVVPHLSPEMARVCCGLLCATALSVKSFGDYRAYPPNASGSTATAKPAKERASSTKKVQ
ncbi:hypothetical protein H4R35_003930 [Dimargaris xerosporica]|nr:hypothetical protein H4R35_003930 [Dimargaris xerosporica]